MKLYIVLDNNGRPRPFEHDCSITYAHPSYEKARAFAASVNGAVMAVLYQEPTLKSVAEIAQEIAAF